MKNLVELVSRMERLADREAVVYDDGLRTRRWSYRELRRHIAGAQGELRARGLRAGDRILLWGENRPEWIAAFWAALVSRVVVVPLDFRSSPAFVDRIQKDVSAKLLVHGAKVDPRGLEIPRLALESMATSASDSPIEPSGAEPDDVFQILFTSGTTGDPKGVVHRHRHIVSTLVPIEREIAKYAAMARPFQPVRFLDLLPSSHVFGQFTGLFVPVVMGGSVVFLREIHPGAIIETIARERVSVLISVPRFLESLRREVERRFEVSRRARVTTKGLPGGLRRYFRHLDVHRTFGLKFWAILSGGARLPPGEEDFWHRLGFVLVQGYGLTETGSLVTTNHPFHPTRGALGKAVGNQQVELAPDGEILVRGDNVSLEVFGKDRTEAEWLHTGDLGEIGPDGNLYYKGRKKDVIIGPEGLNVFPSDVESALLRNPAVRDAVVLGRRTERGETVHAVLLLSHRSADPADIVDAANRELEQHQKIRGWMVWPGEDFPRTPSTFKVRRYEVAEVLETRRAPRDVAAADGTAARALLAEQLGRRPEELRSSQKLSEDLGLSSLDRIELLASLEEKYGVALSESTMAEVTTLEDLERWIADDSMPADKARPSSPLSGIVRAARTLPVRVFRRAFRETVILPLFRQYIPLAVEGTLEGVEPPVIFAPNHTSNLDTLALLAALPRSFRDRLAPAVSQDYFLPYLEATGSFGERVSLGFQFALAVTALNVFPLPQATRGVRDALHFAGELVDRGYSILIFPEGRRTPDGSMRAFRPGVGLMAVRLRIPVVPVRIHGLFEVLPVDASWPKPGPARIHFGSPLSFTENEDYETAAEAVERAVKRLGGVETI